MVYSVKVMDRQDQSTFGSWTAEAERNPPAADQVQSGVDWLKNGGVVAFPTDTLYGLGADFSSPPAGRRLLDIKGRSQHMGLPLLLAGADQLAQVARDIPAEAWSLIDRFWPGALTLVVPRSAVVSDLVTGGRDTVAVRVPDHPVPRALAAGLGRPIIGSSANLTGKPPASTADEVRVQLGDRVDLVIDGGSPILGQASTIVDVTSPLLRVLRLGAISLDEISDVYPGRVEPLAPPQ